jgi:hypothetical protein
MLATIDRGASRAYRKQGIMGSRMHRWPTLTAVTPSPSWRTTPALSWPMMTGLSALAGFPSKAALPS